MQSSPLVCVDIKTRLQYKTLQERKTALTSTSLTLFFAHSDVDVQGCGIGLGGCGGVGLGVGSVVVGGVCVELKIE